MKPTDQPVDPRIKQITKITPDGPRVTYEPVATPVQTCVKCGHKDNRDIDGSCCGEGVDAHACGCHCECDVFAPQGGEPELLPARAHGWTSLEFWNTRVSQPALQVGGANLSRSERIAAEVVSSKWMATPDRHYADLISAVAEIVDVNAPQLPTPTDEVAQRARAALVEATKEQE